MKSTQDAVYIITATPSRGETLKQIVALRNIDEILCIPYDGAALLLKANPPALALIDTESDGEKLLQLMRQIPASVKSLVLNDRFDEEIFLTCHDHGARDFLVLPVPDAYLVSRVIRILQEHRLNQIDDQKDQILVEMGVLSERSEVFTTSYLLKMLKRETESLSAYSSNPVSLLIIQLEGAPPSLPAEAQQALYRDIARIVKECARGFDLVGEYFMDKFAVILPQTGQEGARALANRLQKRLDAWPFRGSDAPIPLKIRMGMAESTGCRHYEDLLNRAIEDLRSGDVRTLHAV